MKIRGDFVTNSSSSSFIIASNLEGDELKDKLLQIFGVPMTSPLRSFADMIARELSFAKEISLKDTLDMFDVEEIEDLPAPYKNAYKKGLKIREGFASNEGEVEELALCYMAFDYEDDELILCKEEGY